MRSVVERGMDIIYYPRGPFCELFGLVQNEPAGWMSSMFGDKEALRGPR